MTPLITTKRLRLRRPVMADMDDIHAIFSDAEATVFGVRGPHRSRAETTAWLQPVVDDPGDAEFDLFIEHEDRIVGQMGSWRLPEVGFILHRAHWGKGLAREALLGFIGHIRARRVSDHLFADVDPRNHRSKRLLEGCGFRPAGSQRNTQHSHIGWCDSDYYRLTF